MTTCTCKCHVSSNVCCDKCEDRNTTKCNCLCHSQKEYVTSIPKECCMNCLAESILVDEPTPKLYSINELKKLTYFVLLITPIIAFIRLQYGMEIMFISILLLLYGQCYTTIIDWLMKKF